MFMVTQGRLKLDGSERVIVSEIAVCVCERGENVSNLPGFFSLCYAGIVEMAIFLSFCVSFTSFAFLF